MTGPVLVHVRPRRPEDLDELAAVLADVHHADHYPHRLPEDPGSFLSTADQLGAWVAVVGDRPVGHVLLRASGPEPVMAVAREAAGLEEGEVAVVARLFVGPAGRGGGAGRALLETAVAEAAARDRVALLDVTATLTAAVALYERAGWRRIGAARVEFPDGSALDQDVYLGPDLRE